MELTQEERDFLRQVIHNRISAIDIVLYRVESENESLDNREGQIKDANYQKKLLIEIKNKIK